MEERESEGSAQRQRYPGIEGTKERLGVLYTDMEDSAGGARKATKSKLFEFLVHGVVSERASVFVHVEACQWLALTVGLRCSGSYPFISM